MSSGWLHTGQRSFICKTVLSLYGFFSLNISPLRHLGHLLRKMLSRRFGFSSVRSARIGLKLSEARRYQSPMRNVQLAIHNTHEQQTVKIPQTTSSSSCVYSKRGPRGLIVDNSQWNYRLRLACCPLPVDSAGTKF